MTEIITYKCRRCGNRFVISETGKGQLSPIYCCGGDVMKGTKRRSIRKTVKPKKSS